MRLFSTQCKKSRCHIHSAVHAGPQLEIYVPDPGPLDIRPGFWFYCRGGSRVNNSTRPGKWTLSKTVVIARVLMGFSVLASKNGSQEALTRRTIKFLRLRTLVLPYIEDSRQHQHRCGRKSFRQAGPQMQTPSSGTACFTILRGRVRMFLHLWA